jgi:hypothetical protein
MINIDIKNLLKYLLEGFAVAMSAYIILRKQNTNFETILIIGLTAAAVYAILDNFTPELSDDTRRGSGVSIGWNLLNI